MGIAFDLQTQAAGDAAPAVETVLRGHVVHAGELVELEKVPAGHCEQTDVAVPRAVPGGQL